MDRRLSTLAGRTNGQKGNKIDNLGVPSYGSVFYASIWRERQTTELVNTAGSSTMDDTGFTAVMEPQIWWHTRLEDDIVCV